jgi:hypothetical protein
VIAVIAARAPAAAADPALSLQLGGAGGVGYASLAGLYEDDDFVALRFGVGIGRFVAADLSIHEDVARIEPAIGLGARVRLWDGACWCARWSPYVRGEVAAVGASHVGSNYDLTVGIGHWGRLTRWLGWYGEVDAIARAGEVQTWSLHVEVGAAVQTPGFWRD